MIAVMKMRMRLLVPLLNSLSPASDLLKTVHLTYDDYDHISTSAGDCAGGSVIVVIIFMNPTFLSHR